MIWFVIFVLLAVLITVVCLSYIQINVNYKRHNKDDRLTLLIKACFGLIRYKQDVPVIQFKGLDGMKDKVINKKDENIDAKKVKNGLKKTKMLIKYTDDLLDVLKRMLKHTTCTYFKWHTQVGWKEAHLTAMSAGAIWAIKAPLSSFFLNLVNQQSKPDLDVRPIYNTNLFSTEASCIVKIRFGYAMFAGILLIIRIVKVKGGVRTWKNILFKA